MILRSLVLGLLPMSVFVTGCGERRFTRDRFEMVQPHFDTRDDVREMIGRPEFDAGDEWYFEDKKRHYAARVFFDEHGLVRDKEWLDAKHGRWDGKHPDAAAPPAGVPYEQRTRSTTIDDD